MDGIVNWVIKTFSGLIALKLGKEIIVFVISILPILELRGGLLAASLLGMDPLPSYIISMIGNILPVPFIILFMNKILEWMRKSKVKFINKIAVWFDRKVDKNRNSIEKYGYLGLTLFVGIPLPGTGAWTGCLIASALEMDRKKSFISIMAGIFMASIIMMIISFGLLKSVI